MKTPISRRQWIKSISLAAASVALASVGIPAAASRDGKASIRLDMNENPYGFSDKTAQAIRAALPLSNRYPIRAQEALQELIAAREQVPRECVLLGTGCTQIFCLACLVHGADGKEVLVAEPDYFLFDQYADQVGGDLLRVPVNGRWELDLDAMSRRASGRTRLVYVCNPNNPTGTVVEPKRLRRFCEELSRRSAVFVDEAYYELVEESRRGSMIGLVRDGAKLVVGRTFSKVYGLAGLRIGYGIGHPQLIAQMRRIQMNLAPVSQLGIAAARAAYQDGDYVTLTRRRNAEVRTRFYQVLDGLGFQSIPGSQTNFVCFRASGGERRLVADLRERYGIAVRAVHFQGRDWVRVSMGRPGEMEQLAAALQALA